MCFVKKRNPSTLAHGPEKPPASKSPLRQALAAVSAMHHHYISVPRMPTGEMIEAAALQHNISPALAARIYHSMTTHGDRSAGLPEKNHTIC